MESFQASIQISQPLNDHAWNLLKPRLLTQRASAEKREKEKSEQSHLLQAEYKQRRQQEAQLKDRKEHMEREWDNMQTPIRNHIAELADQRIEGKWGGGKYVTKENCPQFAADVLLNVRQQFYNEVSHQNKKALLGKNMGIDVTVSSNRILILENMRWLFDTKIKPFTESFQKELFLCHGCDGNFKFYGLESVVQHYAAKHTTTLSCGPQVVSWRAEWPEYPLFHPEPSVAKAASYKVPTPLNGFLQIPPNRDPEILNNFGNFGRTKISSAQPALDMYNASQFPSTTFKDVHAPTYHPRQDGHHSPSKTLNTWHPNFQAPQDTTIHNSNILPSLSTSQASQAFNPQLPHYAYPEFSKAQDHEPKAWHGPDTSEHNSGILTRQSNFSTKPSISSYPPYQVPVGEQSEQTIRSYHFQLEEMAKHTREVWDAISDIKDIPESVRIYVVIQNMVSRFRKTFPQDPSLGMFSDGLNHNALMRPIRTLKGLGCKVCVMNGSGAGRSQQYFAQLPIGDRWLYTLPQLLQHFRVAHVEFPSLPSDTTVGLENLRLDWKFDMIELPETHLVKNLINAPGLDDMKLSLITGVFPGVFPTLKPRIGARDSRDLASGYGAGYYVAGKRQGITAEIYSGSPSISEPVGEAQLPHRPYSAFRELSQPAHSSESPGEDEYDPHRPAVLGKTVPSRTRMTRPRKGFRASPLDTANSSLWCPEDNFSPASLKSIDHSNSYKITSDRRIEGSDQSDHFYKRSDRIQHSVSPQKQTNPLPGVKLSNELPNQFKEHAYEDVNGQDSIDIPSPKHSRVSENDQADDRSTSLGPGKRSVSAQEDATAAEEFLDSLASLSSINHARKSVPSHREESGPMVQPEGTSRDTDRQINSNSALESQGWRADIGSQRSEVDKHVIPIRTGLSKGNEYDEPNLYKTPIFDHEYDTSHRSQSQLHRSSNKSRIGRRSPNTYGTYEAPSRTIIHNRYETNEQIMETPQFRDGSFRTARTSQYRSRSRSPRPIPLGTTYYRARTPTEERRQEPVYHVRSPSLHKDTRPPRVIGYDYPTHDRYEYIDDRRLSDHGLRQRVEFVPVRVEDRQSLEPSRFVLAQPTEMMTQPNYVRLDRAYDVDPVYEHHGQFYHADSRPHHAQQSHGTPTFTQGYRH